MDFYKAFLYLVLLSKLYFVYTVVVYRMKPTPENSEKVTMSDNIFKVLMSLLMIYLFRPNSPSPVRIEGHTKLFLFVFGLLTIVDFFKEVKTGVKKVEGDAAPTNKGGTCGCASSLHTDPPTCTAV
jgi:uncharacterized protein YhhL (DUF1145 family)